MTRPRAGAGLLRIGGDGHAAGKAHQRNRTKAETARNDERRAQKLRQVRRRIRERAAAAAR